MPYGWMNKAPIREVDSGEVAGIATTLRTQIAAWGQGSENWDPARRHHINKTGADGLLQNLEILGGEELNYVYEYGGLVIGLLIVNLDSDHISVADLLAHPGTEGAGVTLLEFAVTLSQQHGCHGKLKLYALNQNASDFYLKMGFVRTEAAGREGGGNMVLDPATRSDIWQQGGDGEWMVKTYVGKKFAAETG
jgi:GNAT superfamily N-acetyltransferase